MTDVCLKKFSVQKLKHHQELCALAPGYNMGILRGYSASGHRRTDGAQEACIYALCFDSAGSNCGALRGEPYF